MIEFNKTRNLKVKKQIKKLEVKSLESNFSEAYNQEPNQKIKCISIKKNLFGILCLIAFEMSTCVSLVFCAHGLKFFCTLIGAIRVKVETYAQSKVNN